MPETRENRESNDKRNIGMLRVARIRPNWVQSKSRAARKANFWSWRSSPACTFNMGLKGSVAKLCLVLASGCEGESWTGQQSIWNRTSLLTSGWTRSAVSCGLNSSVGIGNSLGWSCSFSWPGELFGAFILSTGWSQRYGRHRFHQSLVSLIDYADAGDSVLRFYDHRSSQPTQSYFD